MRIKYEFSELNLAKVVTVDAGEVPDHVGHLALSLFSQNLAYNFLNLLFGSNVGLPLGVLVEDGPELLPSFQPNVLE